MKLTEEYGYEVLPDGTYKALVSQYSAKMVLKSVGPNGVEISTMEVVLPRFVLAQFNTHRDFSRGSASSRAIPVHKMIKSVKENPYVPFRWPINKKGMQASDYLTDKLDISHAVTMWHNAKIECINTAKELMEFNIHKEVCNRLIEPFLWQKVLVTSTRWNNFFAQRCDEHAQDDIRYPAELMQLCLNESKPHIINAGSYHLPYISYEEHEMMPITALLERSVARCARVSYDKPGEESRSEKSVFEDMKKNNHWSPFEHQAVAISPVYALNTEYSQYEKSGNFHGWQQVRKDFEGEYKW